MPCTSTGSPPIRRGRSVNTPPLAANALAAYARNGVTTAQEGGAQKATLQLLQSAASAGLLNMDVIAYHMVGNDDLTVVDHGDPLAPVPGHLVVCGGGRLPAAVFAAFLLPLL